VGEEAAAQVARYEAIPAGRITQAARDVVDRLVAGGEEAA
jgi:hypothetical protein